MAAVTLLISFLLSNLAVLHSAECPHSHFCNHVIGKISFPFKSREDPPECGLYTVNCSEGSPATIQLREGGYWHELTNISNNSISIIINKELQKRLKSAPCDDGNIDGLSLPSPSPICNVSTTSNLTLLKCTEEVGTIEYKELKLGCSSAFSHTYYYISPRYVLSPPPQCSVVQLLLLPGWNNSVQPDSILNPNFTLQVTVSKKCSQCASRGGICQLQAYKGEPTCSAAKGNVSGLKLGIGLAGAGGLVILVLVVVYCFRRKLTDKSTFFWMNKTQSHQIIQEFLMHNGLLQVKRYSYLDVKKMTNSFKEKLGQGGYGGVYKGKLNDGRIVAVKVLNRPKGDGEDFINEVAAISRTSHVNIVSLLGFCFEGSERSALIYEFMPNGSLEKFIFNANNPQEDHHLGWEALDRIALGIARGLEYLHRGCSTRILHFDIKPHNILLSENFSPKISDFGLAKICKEDKSIVSMMGARGTAGYIAPEVFCRNFGGVSHKSDVYSYGMMLSEMVGGRRNVNDEVENTSEIYFPHWIYKRLELDEEFGLQSIRNEEDKVRARKMVIVSLWCIQTDPSNRPAMRQVIKMLEGSVDSLQIPPKPYLSSPPRSLAEPAHSSSTWVSLQ